MVATRRGLVCFLGFIVAFVTSGNAAEDVYTPVVVSALNAWTQAVVGADGKQHLVYELVLTNASRVPATLQRIEVVDANDPAKVLATFDGAGLIAHLHNTGNMPAEKAEIPFNETWLALLNFSVASGGAVPARLLHRITLTGTAPGHKPDEVTIKCPGSCRIRRRSRCRISMEIML